MIFRIPRSAASFRCDHRLRNEVAKQNTENSNNTVVYASATWLVLCMFGNERPSLRRIEIIWVVGWTTGRAVARGSCFDIFCFVPSFGAKSRKSRPGAFVDADSAPSSILAVNK